MFLRLFSIRHSAPQLTLQQLRWKSTREADVSSTYLVIWKKGEKTPKRTARKAETVSGTIFTDMCETGEIITSDKLLRSQNQSVNMRIIESSKMILTWRKIWIAGPTPGYKIWGVLKKNWPELTFSLQKWDKITTFERKCSIRPVLDDKKNKKHSI